MFRERKVYENKTEEDKKMNKKIVRFMFVVFSFFVLLWTSQAEASTPLPAVSGPVAVTETSHPFNAAAWQIVPLDLAAVGYVEEEYFVSGFANVYNWNTDGSVTVRTAHAPYTTRILVRRPIKPQAFSGNVYVEMPNWASYYDNPFVWMNSHDYFLSHGDAYVLVTIRPTSAVMGLKTFDPVRYASLSFNNPQLPEDRCLAPFADPGHPQTTFDTEDGLGWDIVSQVGALVRSKNSANPLVGYDVKYVYSVGMTGGDGATYVNAIHPLAVLDGGQPVYDGHLILATGRPENINQCAPRPDSNDPRSIIHSNVPVIRIFTQSDILGKGVHSSSSCMMRRDDSDTIDPYRHYEVPGATVGFKYPRLSGPCQQDVEATGNTFNPVVLPPIEFPLWYIMNGAFANLDEWVRTGQAPPRADRVLTKADCSDFILDQFGNTQGGVRTPYVDVPIATYPVSGNAIPFTHDLLGQLYKNHGNYVSQVVNEANELQKDNWVFPKDANAIKTEASQAGVP